MTSLLVKNYLYPCLYAVGAAVAAAAAQMLQGAAPFDVKVLGIDALGALLGFVLPRLNPYAGKDEPVVHPHK